MTTTTTPSAFETQDLACAPKPQTDWRPEWMRQGLAEALQRYWGAAYAEGREGRDHDTEDDVAGLALRDVMLALADMLNAERAAERESSHAEFRVQNKCIADQHDEIARLRAALTLAANRLDVLALDHEYGTTLRNVTEDLTKETRVALGPSSPGTNSEEE